MTTREPAPLSSLSRTELTDRLSRALFGENPPKIDSQRRVHRKLSSNSNSKVDEALQNTTDRAAVTARFFPSEIVKDLPEVVAEAVLSRVSPDCDFTVAEGRRVWMLGREQRRNVLLRLKDQREYLLSLLRLEPAQPWDEAGTYLQALLRDGKLDRTPSSLSEMRALAQAYDWVSGIVDVKGADQKLRQAMAFKSLLEEKKNLLRNGFFDRKEALETFDLFLSADLNPEKPLPPVLSISGIGGSGKSAFLAFVTRRLLQRAAQPGVPAVFQIDFDRFGLGANSIIELTFEITRQIALYDPSLAEPFSKLRANLRAQLAATTTRTEARASFALSLMSQIKPMLATDAWRQRDILLVLDTFEELQAKGLGAGASSGAYAADQIATWIRQLVDQAGLARLRVVVSGRAPITGGPMLVQHVAEKIALEDLDPPASVQLLTSAGLSTDIASPLREAIGGNPLMLVIAARLMRGLAEVKRADVLRGLSEETKDLDKELVQGVLYGRILDHIRDEGARKLAHPGLVLRRVTWRLICDVLAKPCDLGDVDKESAEALVNSLANEVWLVERDARRPEVLVHRSDIRRMMLRLMANERSTRTGGSSIDRAEQVRAIHQKALEFYKQHVDPEDDDAIRESEEFYHRMMLVDEAGAGAVGSSDLERIASTFGGDVDLLTPSLRLRVRQMRDEPLTPDDAVNLPEDDWRLWAYREGEARLERHEPLAALALIAQRPIGEPDEAPAWQLRALDAAARWDQLSGEWLERVSLPRMAPRDNSSENWARHSAAKSLLLLRRGQSAAAIVVMNGVLIEMRTVIRNMARDQSNLADHLRCANYALLARREFNRTHPEDARMLVEAVAVNWPFEELPATVDTYELDLELRRYIALNWRPGEILPVKRLGFTAFAFVPDPDWLQAIAEFVDVPDMSDFLSRMQDGASIADILGQIASDFSVRMARSRNRGTIAQRPPDNFDPSLLCGEYPEMRPAAKFALRQAFPSSGDLRQLAELIQPLLPIKPRDLQPDSFGSSDVLPGESVSLLVDYADRSHVLAKLLDVAARERPKSEVLKKVANSVAQWDAMFSRPAGENRTAQAIGRTKQDPNRQPRLPYVERATAEATRPDTNLRDRKGYDRQFLGMDVPEPTLSQALAADANRTPLRYCRFSILTSRRSRLPIYAAANLGGDRQWGLEQSIDPRAFHGQMEDPRLSPAQQSLLRRGRSFAFAIAPETMGYGSAHEAIQAIGDTRFAPNHIPLQGMTIEADIDRLWHGIEQQLIGSSGDRARRGLLFTGVVAERTFLFWKVVVRKANTSGLTAAAFSMRSDDRDVYAVRQIRLKDLEQIVGLNFGLPAEAESLVGAERPVSNLFDIRPPD